MIKILIFLIFVSCAFKKPEDQVKPKETAKIEEVKTATPVETPTVVITTTTIVTPTVVYYDIDGDGLTSNIDPSEYEYNYPKAFDFNSKISFPLGKTVFDKAGLNLGSGLATLNLNSSDCLSGSFYELENAFLGNALYGTQPFKIEFDTQIDTKFFSPSEVMIDFYLATKKTGTSTTVKIHSEKMTVTNPHLSGVFQIDTGTSVIFDGNTFLISCITDMTYKVQGTGETKKLKEYISKNDPKLIFENNLPVSIMIPSYLSELRFFNKSIISKLSPTFNKSAKYSGDFIDLGDSSNPFANYKGFLLVKNAKGSIFYEAYNQCNDITPKCLLLKNLFGWGVKLSELPNPQNNFRAINDSDGVYLIDGLSSLQISGVELDEMDRMACSTSTWQAPNGAILSPYDPVACARIPTAELYFLGEL